jgi:nickel transport protein
MMRINYKLQNLKLKTQISLLLGFSFFLICAFCFVREADAHKVNIYAYAEDGMIHAESYFGNGTRCKNSLIEVLDEKTGARLLEGKTDENGKFSFKIPKVTSLKLVLHASMGHQNEYTLGEDEVRESMGDKQPPKEVKETAKSFSKPAEISVKASKSLAGNGAASALRGMSEPEMEAMIEKVVDSKLKPVMGILVKLQESSEKPRLTEIIGGIGYIVGLMGLVMYLKNRR